MDEKYAKKILGDMSAFNFSFLRSQRDRNQFCKFIIYDYYEWSKVFVQPGAEGHFPDMRGKGIPVYVVCRLGGNINIYHFLEEIRQ